MLKKSNHGGRREGAGSGGPRPHSGRNPRNVHLRNVFRPIQRELTVDLVYVECVRCNACGAMYTQNMSSYVKEPGEEWIGLNDTGTYEKNGIKFIPHRENCPLRIDKTSSESDKQPEGEGDD